MSFIKIIDAFTFYGFDTVLLAILTCLTVQLLKITAFKKCQKKILTFLPFLVGALFYAAYAAIRHLSFAYLVENYVSVLENGFSVGAVSTLVYVWYEQFVRSKKESGASQSVIQTLIDGYVPSEKVSAVAEQIAHAIERDVTGDGAAKTEEILLSSVPEDVQERDIKMLARLIIETLAHINAK